MSWFHPRQFRVSHQSFSEQGFTLMELILVMGLFALFASLTAINLIRPQNQADLTTTVQTLVAEIKQQQIKAMVGDSEGQSSAQQYGVYFENDRYVIFRGTGYAALEVSNYQVTLSPSLRLTTINLPSSQIVFSRSSGEVANFAPSSNQLIFTSDGGDTRTLTINRYGVVVVN